MSLSILESALNGFADFIWSAPTVVLLVGGGLFLTCYSRLACFRYFPHAINFLRSKFDRPQDPGHVSHAQALSTALSSTLGLGNIAGVAITISTVGPGAVFWMWLTALIVSDAFSGQAVVDGTLGSTIMIGVRRGAFSNEAGIGTESMAHGAARTD
ncbi:hypothetical protein GCM10027567_00100 [Spongiibacter taiwanensis]